MSKKYKELESDCTVYNCAASDYDGALFCICINAYTHAHIHICISVCTRTCRRAGACNAFE